MRDKSLDLKRSISRTVLHWLISVGRFMTDGWQSIKHLPFVETQQFCHHYHWQMIKWVVIETTGVWCHDVTMTWRYDITTLQRYVFLRYTMIKFAIHRSFFQNALVEYIGVFTDTNKSLNLCTWESFPRPVLKIVIYFHVLYIIRAIYLKA